mgnify:CR=1 FL=1
MTPPLERLLAENRTKLTGGIILNAFAFILLQVEGSCKDGLSLSG